MACVWRIDNLLVETDFVFRITKARDRLSKKGEKKGRSNDWYHIPYLLIETIHHEIENHSLAKLLGDTHFMSKYLNSAISAVHQNYL